MRPRGGPLVSLYLPTTPIAPEVEADRIAFKNLTAEAIEQLRAAGAGSADREAIEEALDDLHDDRDFWSLQAHSLAVFAGPDGMLTFRLPNRLTAAVQVADRHYLKPLLRTVTFPQSAFVLALAEGSVRLLEATPDLPTFEVTVPDLPEDAAGAAVLAVRREEVPGGGDPAVPGLRRWTGNVARCRRPPIQTSAPC